MLKVAQELIRKLLLLGNGFTTRVSFVSRNFGCIRPQMEFMGSYMSQRILIPSFMPCITSFLNQLLRWLKINYIGQNVNSRQHTVKPQYFWSTSIFLSHLHHLIKGWSRFLKESPQIIKSQKLPNFLMRSQLNFDQA